MSGRGWTAQPVAWLDGDEDHRIDGARIVGRAEIRYTDGGLIHGLLIDLGPGTPLRIVYWERNTNRFRTFPVDAEAR